MRRVISMGFVKLSPDLRSHYWQPEGSFRANREGLGLGCRRNRHFQQQIGWSDFIAQITMGGNYNQQQVSSAIKPRASWMTPSRTGCDHLDFRTSGNASWREMTHQVQM